jgi:hypothetical protein
LPKIAELKLGFRRALPLNVRVGGSKAWASQRDAEQFQRNQVTSRGLNELMARLPVAR